MIDDAFLDVAHAIKKDPAWVIDQFIPVGLTFMAGPPKISHKSSITLALAAMCARWPARVMPRWMRCTLGGPSMIFSYEADGGEVRSMMEDGLGVEVEEGAIYVAHDPWEYQLDVKGAVDRLVDYLELKMPRLVVMDPFRNMWSGDENDSGAIIQVLGPVQRWLKLNEAAGIVVHHVNKPQPQGLTEAGGMFAMRGSSAIPGLADGIVVIEPTKHDGQVVINARFKRGQPWRRTIQLGAPGYGWPSSGYEVLPELCHSVADHWGSMRGDHDLEWLAQAATTHKQTVSAIKAAIEGLVRNQMLTMTDVERSILLPAVPGV